MNRLLSVVLSKYFTLAQKAQVKGGRNDKQINPENHIGMNDRQGCQRLLSKDPKEKGKTRVELSESIVHKFLKKVNIREEED